MLSLLPEYADPIRLCGLGKAYEGTIPLAEMPRLAPLLTSSRGEAAFKLVFGLDGERRPEVVVGVQARLALECQRCLGETTQEVNSVSRLVVVTGPDQAEALPDEVDPLLLTEERVALKGLVEDELILAIPPSPMHPEDACEVDLASMNEQWKPVAGEANDSAEPNPFAALAALKRSDEDTQD